MSYLRQTIFMFLVLILTTINSFALKAEYRFEDCRGVKTVKNFEGNDKLDGKLFKDAKIDIGKIKYGLNLNGNGGMFVPHDKELDLIDNLTISFWLKPKKREREALIVKGAGDGDDRKYGSSAEYSIVLWEDGRIKYKHNGKADTFSKSTLPLNEWSHIVVVRDNGLKTVTIYINGEFDSYSKYSTEPVSSNSEQLIIGLGDYYSKTMNSFQGVIDEIKIYNYGLSNREISKMYKLESKGSYYTRECPEYSTPEASNDEADLPVEGKVSVDVLSNDRTFDNCHFDISSIVLFSDNKNAVLSDNNKTLTVKGEGIWIVDDSKGMVEFVSDCNFYDNPTPIYYRVKDSCGGWSNRAMISLARIAVTQPTSTPTPIKTPLPTKTPGATPTPIKTPSPVKTPRPTPTPIVIITPNPIPTPTITPTKTPSPVETLRPTPTDKGFKIGDRVWLDVNGNGLQDTLELGVKGVIVTLFNSDGNKIDTTTTDKDGNYIFSGLDAGEYSLSFKNLPDGCKFTVKDRGSSDNNDSDVDENGDIFNINLKSDDLTNDAGLICQSDQNLTAEDCDCDDYTSSVPALNGVLMLLMFLLLGYIGFWFDIKKNY